MNKIEVIKTNIKGRLHSWMMGCKRAEEKSENYCRTIKTKSYCKPSITLIHTSNTTSNAYKV